MIVKFVNKLILIEKIFKKNLKFFTFSANRAPNCCKKLYVGNLAQFAEKVKIFKFFLKIFSIKITVFTNFSIINKCTEGQSNEM